MSGSRLVITGADGTRDEDNTVRVPDQRAAVAVLIELLGYLAGLKNIAVVGHRVVHGGNRFCGPELITPGMLDELRKIVPYDPDHLPGEIEAIDAFLRLVPEIPHVACFDTALHHDLPRVTQIIPIPRPYEAAGIRRFGFHGLSYAFLIEELANIAGPLVARGRVILAHLGSGASLAAVRDGRCLETTMGLTATSGLVMGTHLGDIDPGLVRYLMRAEGLTIDQFQELVNHESGLLGVSESSPNCTTFCRVRTPIREPRSHRAVLYRAKLGIGASQPRRPRYRGLRGRDRRELARDSSPHLRCSPRVSRHHGG